MRILNRYVRHAIFAAILLVVLTLLGVESFMEFIGQLPKIGIAHYDMWRAFTFVLMQLPADLYQLFPVVGFLGCLIGLGRLASTSELIIMRSAGISIASITWSVIKAALLLMMVVTFIGELIAPNLEATGRDMRARALSASVGFKALGGIWLRDANSFVHVGAINTNQSVSDVTRFVITPQHQLVSATHAAKAIYENDHWTMLNAKQSHFMPARVITTTLHHLPLNVVLNPTLLEEGRKRVDQQSVAGLYRTIAYRNHAKLTTAQYEFAFWQRLIQPVTTVVMICLGVPFIFGSLRSASMGLRVLTGVIIGFIFYTLNQFFGPFALVYQIPAIVAAMVPTLIFAIICIWLLMRVRT